MAAPWPRQPLSGYGYGSQAPGGRPQLELVGGAAGAGQEARPQAGAPQAAPRRLEGAADKAAIKPQRVSPPALGSKAAIAAKRELLAQSPAAPEAVAAARFC